MAASSSSGRRRGTGGDGFAAELDRASRSIPDPVAKLRFIRSSLDHYRKIDLRIRMVPLAPLRRLLSRVTRTEGLTQLLGAHPLGLHHEPAAVRRAERIRRALGAALLTGAAAGLAVAGAGLYRRVVPPAAATAVASTAAAAEPAPEAIGPVSGIAPAAVWLVERGPGWEQYSNGLRIDTGWSVAGEARQYRLFTEEGGAQGPLRHEPAGILFHTTESDIWPLEASYNDSLRVSTQKLLRYVGRKRLYHYLIDRFGRVYRLVQEETKANHAGHSVWAQGPYVYVSLNHAFLGVAFESRWEGGQALPISQAQLGAGRNLTDYLRQRWQIQPEMCVTHGLTSVNPRKGLIGHHLDWARGFPFEAFGLPDQYNRLAPSVAVFGFGYDDDFLKVLGEPWTGVRDAERILTEEARRQGRSLDELRSQRQRLYDAWVAEQARDEAEGAASRAQQWPASNESGG